MKKVILISSLFCILIWGCKKDDSPVIAPITDKPVVKISSLQNNSTITDTVSIVAQATDDKGIVKVEIYVDGKTDSSKTLFVPPYRYLWDVRNLNDGSSHIVYAKAYDADNNVESSEVLNVTVRRFQPSDLVVKMNVDTAAVLTWSDNCKFETGFEIEKGILSANGQTLFTLIKTTEANVTQAVIEGNYSKDTSYAFRIRAVSQNGKSLYSNEAVTYLNIYAPTNLKISNVDAENIGLTWTSSNSFTTQYEVEQSTNNGQFIFIGTIGTNSLTVRGLSLATNDYSFRVRAKTKYNLSTYSNVVAAAKISLQTFGPVRIYETVGTTASQPAGLILSSGNTSGIGSSAPDRDKVDLFYSSNGYIVASADQGSGLTRVTYFKIGSSQTLTDTVNSPIKDATWVKSFQDTQHNYVFVLDNDGHYSKLQIVSVGGGIPGNPAYVEVKWIYNKIAGSRIF